MMTQKLSSTQLDLMYLITRSPDLGDGWVSCSSPVYSMFSGFPREILEMVDLGELGKRVRLTPLGKTVMEAKSWL